MRGLSFPVFVPLPGVGRLIDDLAVGERPRDVEREPVGALPFVARIDLDPDPLALRIAVAPGQLLDDRRVHLIAIEAKVDRVLVVEHAQLRPFGWLAAVERKLLRERLGGRHRLPGGVVQAAVDQRRLGGVNGDEMRGLPRLTLVSRP